MRVHLTVFFIGIILLSGCSTKENSAAEETLPVSYVTTFKVDEPVRIDVELFDKLSDQAAGLPAAAKKEITEKQEIREIMNHVTALPDKGDIMIKMGDVSVITVTLIYADQKLYFTVYGNRIKTPDTSFYSAPPDAESSLVALLLSSLHRNIE